MCDMEGRAGQSSLSQPSLHAGRVDWVLWGAWLSCTTWIWGQGSALDCRQGCEFYAVLPWMQVNRTLNTTADKVQEQSQEVVAST